MLAGRPRPGGTVRTTRTSEAYADRARIGRLGRHFLKIQKMRDL